MLTDAKLTLEWEHDANTVACFAGDDAMRPEHHIKRGDVAILDTARAPKVGDLVVYAGPFGSFLVRQVTSELFRAKEWRLAASDPRFPAFDAKPGDLMGVVLGMMRKV